MTEKKFKNGAEIAWILAVMLCPLGVCLSAKSGFGVSMVVAPAYIIYLKVTEYVSWFTFGMAEYCLQGLLIAVTCVVLRRFKWKYLLSFVTAVCYGIVLDIWNAVIGTQICTVFWLKCVYCICGAVITAFSIALFLRTYLPQEGYELVVKEISDGFKFPVNRVKWVYDASSLALGILLMLCLFGRFSFDMIGVGTLILTVINTPLIAGFGKILDKYFEFDSAFASFYNRFDRIMN